MVRFGYFVPEFPGQTHGFFWRELRALTQLGLEPEPVSTRRPRQLALLPEWARNEVAATHYLTPPSIKTFMGGGTRAFRAVAGGRLGAIVRSAASPYESSRDLDSPRLGYAVARAAALLWAGGELARHAETRQWDHVHVHSCADAAQVALFAHAISGIPYSLTLHGPLSDYGPNQLRKWQNAEFSVVITARLLAEVREALDGHLPGEIRVAPMGVDLDTFKRVAPYKPWSGQGQARIFCCARLNRSKGHADLLKAITIVMSSGFDVHLTLAGEDELGGTGYRQELERLVRELGLERNVRFLGAVPEHKVREELAAAHLFALASHSEPLGVAIMEAMAMGVPVVVTSAGGVRELVVGGESGILVEPHNPGRLAEVIFELLQHPDKALSIAEQGRSRIEQAFDVRTSALVLAELMESKIRRGRT
ncbi:glycosyltransferase involved in cell wall biosynthesis [Pseudarthrobacter sp. PvP004]|uniref:exopolysaccharide biosynthesis GT4 family glycosyltransferase EpsE n=1 Tax=Pseudarthrobacter sp. PvP004 TaxID=2817850 RepID=UPI001AE90C17|nr:exopolysaccharide biosynthesis GT4 family glycosyltransferase EpsE [Pseudarthrobacter sp. PvP004]MBP2265725.1 glycosyltransferase involved in cell wall biosynthesis [Pseudarthrobacter sp. PvP004]